MALSLFFFVFFESCVLMIRLTHGRCRGISLGCQFLEKKKKTLKREAVTDALTGKETEDFSVGHVHMCVLCLCRMQAREKISRLEIHRGKMGRRDSMNGNQIHWLVLKNLLYFRQNSERSEGRFRGDR